MISGSFCLSQMLKADEANVSSKYCFSLGKFSWVGGQGRTGFPEGGSYLVGHEQVGSPGMMVPALEHFMIIGSDLFCACAAARVAVLNTPT